MNLNKHYKTKHLLVVLLKLSIVGLAFYFIALKLTENSKFQWNEFMAFLNENAVFSFKIIGFLILLSILNWFFEILKWKNLVNTLSPITLKMATAQSLGALTTSLITPNRIGDYGAKALFYPKDLRKKIVLLNLLGNLAQMGVTTVLGFIGLLCFIQHYTLTLNYSKILFYSFVLLACGVTVWGLTQSKRFKIKGFSMRTVFDFFKSIERHRLLKTLLYALMRYLIFSFQFYVLLQIFNTTIPYTEAMIGITSLYLLASIIPAISIFDVVIKGSLAVFLFGFLDVNELTILAITTLMWLFNFVGPSILGSYFVLTFKTPQLIKQC